jgi:hypothetical protein
MAVNGVTVDGRSMTLKRIIIICLASLLAGFLGACSTDYSTATDTYTGRKRIYAMSNDAALALAKDAISQSFPDSKIEMIDDPAAGYAAPVRSGLNTSTQKVVIHPVTGMTAAGTAVSGYTFEVTGRGTIGAGDINTATFYARLQQALDTTGDAVDVARVEPRIPSP